MRRDSIFYKLFKQLPGLLFELIEEAPPDAARYRFDSVEVKESAFRIDGVFLPPDDAESKQIFFAEVQFQKDEELYRRFFSELFLFLRRSEVAYDDWAGVLIFGSRSMEPTSATWYRSLLSSSQIYWVYLDELGDWRDQPVELGVMLLTIAEKSEAPEQARFLMNRGAQLGGRRDIIELVSTIMVYKFTELSREEVAAMLNIQDVQIEQTRIYQEIEERQGRNNREAIVVELLTEKFGELSESVKAQLAAMPVDKLKSLTKALLNFQELADLEAWFAANL
ncbi:Rpn family recombination-promoting nuclease/putative transposase [Phormidesmis sp. 146-12]